MADFKREPIRSKKIRNAAKGEECTLQIVGCCVGGTDKTVFAHLHDETFGMSIKADDTSGCFACVGCHDEIDGKTRKTNGADLTWYKFRAMKRTIRRLVELGIIFVPQDKPKQRKPAVRSSAGQSKPVKARSQWVKSHLAKGRKLESRNNLRRERT